MAQDQQPRPWWKDNLLVWALAALTLTSLVIATILGYCQKRALFHPTLQMLQIIFIFLFLFLVLLVVLVGGTNFLYASNGTESCQNQAEPSWTPQEQWVWRQLCEGEIADFNQRDGRPDRLDPRKPEGWQENRKLRTEEFLEKILLNEPYRSVLPPDGVRIEGGWFVEPLDLSNAVLMQRYHQWVWK
jgi:hypothetical protein